MHFPAANNCASCYASCLSGAPPVPPHAVTPRPGFASSGSNTSPQRCQPRAVTLPHPAAAQVNATNHAHSYAGFQSLPHPNSPGQIRPCNGSLAAQTNAKMSVARDPRVSSSPLGDKMDASTPIQQLAAPSNMQHYAPSNMQQYAPNMQQYTPSNMQQYAPSNMQQSWPALRHSATLGRPARPGMFESSKCSSSSLYHTANAGPRSGYHGQAATLHRAPAVCRPARPCPPSYRHPPPVTHGPTVHRAPASHQHYVAHQRSTYGGPPPASGAVVSNGVSEVVRSVPDVTSSVDTPPPLPPHGPPPFPPKLNRIAGPPQPAAVSVANQPTYCKPNPAGRRLSAGDHMQKVDAPTEKHPMCGGHHLLAKAPPHRMGSACVHGPNPSPSQKIGPPAHCANPSPTQKIGPRCAHGPNPSPPQKIGPPCAHGPIPGSGQKMRPPCMHGPIAPPPPSLPVTTYDEMKYACLPHQMLVPPPISRDVIVGCPEHGHHHINSCSKQLERPYLGAGQASKNRSSNHHINKAHSLDTPNKHRNGTVPNGNKPHAFRRPQAISQSAAIGNSAQGMSPRAVALDDSRAERWRRNGSISGQTYELSQDLVEKRLEMLEKRYGGERARTAAVVIQRGYRHYAMFKKFRAITATAKAQEKRLSRRFTLESGDWALQSFGTAQVTDNGAKCELDQLAKEFSAAAFTDSKRPTRSISMRTTVPCSRETPVVVEHMNDTSLYCHAGHLTSPTGHDGSIQPGPDVNSYASSKDLKFLSSEESSYGSQDTVASKTSTSSKQKGNKICSKKVPPELPHRSSSIKSSESGGSLDSYAAYRPTTTHRCQRAAPPSLTPPSSTPSSVTSEVGSDKALLKRSTDNGSISSVHSSGSDSSLSQSTSDRATPHDQGEHHEFNMPTSPIWKRKAQMCQGEADDKRLSNISENSEDSYQSNSSGTNNSYANTTTSARYAHASHSQSSHRNHQSKVSDVLRKRQYRVGLNLFNKKPEKGVTYLINKGFFDKNPPSVAKFLLTRKGLSKQMIGEYLGNLQNSFSMAVLECFVTEIDLSCTHVDVALRKFQSYFRMPGEAQKIERLMQVFAQRYCQCNRDVVSTLRDPETIFVLAFAIIMLNTDLHTAALKAHRRMKLDDFVKNLRGVDDGCDINREMLEGLYQRIRDQEFKPGHDHVSQVLKVEQTMLGKRPMLALPHRRLVCYCRLYEVPDPAKRERTGLHQREVFLFNDLLVVTKIFSKKKNSITYTFRQSYPLAGLSVAVREAPHYPFFLEIRQRVDNKSVIMFNARNEHDRAKFCEDLRESVLEMDEMENLRIEGELEKQKANLRASRPTSTAENRDSGVADLELVANSSEKTYCLKPEGTLKRSTLSNSLLDMHEAGL